MGILKKLKQAAAKEVIGSALKSGTAPVAEKLIGKKSKAAAGLLAVAAIATAVAEYL